MILRNSMGRGILLAASLLSAFGQTLPNAVPMPSAVVQFVDANGAPIAGGKLYTCAANSSCPGTPQATYTDSTASVQNTNPVILDSAGRAQIWIGSQAYKLVLQDANSVQQWTQDNVSDTTLYFVNFVKTAGTATLISYNPPNSQPQTTVDAELTALTSSPYVNLKLNCGAKGDGATNDATAIAACLAQNSIVYAPPGTYCTATPIVIPNKTQLIGAGRGDSPNPNTVFKACAGFPTNTPVVSLCSTPGPCFGVQAENFTIDCNGVSGCSGGYNAYSQELSWFRKVLVLNAPAYGIWLDIGTHTTSASQNSGPYEDIEVNSDAAGITGTVCFRALLVPSFRGINGLTCDMSGYASKPTNAIVIEASPTLINNLHLEHATNGLVLGTAAHGGSDYVVFNVEAGPDLDNAVVIGPTTTDTSQNILISGVQNATMGGNSLIDNVNSVTVNSVVGLGTYFIGNGSAGNQTIMSSRNDVALKFQNALTVQKGLSIPGSGADDAFVKFGSSLPYKLWAREGSSGDTLPVLTLGGAPQGRPCFLLQTSDVTGGAAGGGLCLNANGPAADAAFGAVGAGYTGDGATYVARATSAAGIQFSDGLIRFFTDSGLTAGSTFIPTLHLVLGGANVVAVDGVAGFTGTKVAGACTMTFKYGILTAVSGC